MQGKPGNKAEYELPDEINRLVIENLSRIADIQGVATVWVFDNNAHILSYFNRLKIDLQGVTLSIAMLSGWADRVETNLAGEKTKLVFIEFEKLILIINPLTEDTALGIISSVNAPVGQIFWYLDRHVPELQKILAA
jgi:predicted regulator of Ras-like GTPase activity (Roadblock/LC7/MglB family)